MLWRHPAQRARWELAAASLRGFRASLDELGFTEIATPKFVESATESGANVFAVDYFGRPAYLAQSPQFYKQQLVGVFERVYEVGPVFRAEPHDTVRHLAEYRSLDVELGFIARPPRRARGAARGARRDGRGDRARTPRAAVERAGARVPEVPDEIPVIHFADALALVGAPADEPDLAPEHERALGAWALAEHGSDFLAVEGYPMAKRPFYTHPQPERPDAGRTASTCSSAASSSSPAGSGCTGPSDYDAAIRARGEDPADYAAYLQAFRHGMPPHGGFAIGLERWVARLVEATNIREVTLVPARPAPADALRWLGAAADVGRSRTHGAAGNEIGLASRA